MRSRNPNTSMGTDDCRCGRMSVDAIHAARGRLSTKDVEIVTTESRSGLSVTVLMGDQLGVSRDQRAGVRARALR